MEQSYARSLATLIEWGRSNLGFCEGPRRSHPCFPIRTRRQGKGPWPVSAIIRRSRFRLCKGHACLSEAEASATLLFPVCQRRKRESDARPHLKIHSLDCASGWFWPGGELMHSVLFHINQYASELITSPPLVVERALYVAGLREFLMNLTLPSQNVVLTPPECRLRAAMTTWLFGPAIQGGLGGAPVVIAGGALQ